MPQPTNFQIGDNVIVYDHNTSVAPFIWPIACYIKDIQDDYYIMVKRSFNDTRSFRIGRYYPHVKKG